MKKCGTPTAATTKTWRQRLNILDPSSQLHARPKLDMSTTAHILQMSDLFATNHSHPITDNAAAHTAPAKSSLQSNRRSVNYKSFLHKHHRHQSHVKIQVLEAPDIDKDGPSHTQQAFQRCFVLCSGCSRLIFCPVSICPAGDRREGKSLPLR